MAAHVIIHHQHFTRIFKHSLFRAPFHGMRFLSNRSVNVKFQDESVQILLKRITGRNLERILTNRRESGVDLPSYRLMTDNEVSMAEKNMEREVEKFLEMPAVMEERKDSNIVLEQRPDLEGYTECNMVFTDISQNTTNRDRWIVVRQPNGTLRKAHWSERDRMNFLFHQRDGQSYKLPSVLENEHLKNAFDRLGHVDILDLVCVQCEADSSDYIRVHQHTYEDLHKKQAYDLLRSTRHFGGMVYYFAKHKRLTWLLVDMLKRDLISDASDVVRLFYILHPTSLTEGKQLDGVELIRAYIKAEGPKALLDFIEDDVVVNVA
ncbi:28S ribosomal protein S22, mitochondrial-like [Xenia sp. Carnegie-2017]|uniref:28S ribosomal protein S22, mitochondrial-like n=1 Tax=Xenia sp. Carnegie-2017 TaxID=2897299 RepID=UPI001F03D5F2|nr:28S ribosomal protein S22, mitochondrial-like [Xenia sp. Carnegie-2017]